MKGFHQSFFVYSAISEQVSASLLVISQIKIYAVGITKSFEVEETSYHEQNTNNSSILASQAKTLQYLRLLKMFSLSKWLG